MLAQISENLEARCRMYAQFWKFTMLEMRQLHEQAAREAAAADIIWISACGNAESPLLVKAWIELSVGQRKGRPGAFVLSQGATASPDNQPVPAYLRRLASVGAMDFFTTNEILAGKESRLPSSQIAPSPALVANAFEQTRGILRWGINE